MLQERHISSRSHALVKDLRRLAQDPGAYRKLGRVWLEGDHLCSLGAADNPCPGAGRA